MKPSYSLGRFEYFVVAIVVATIAAVAINRYLLLAEQTRQLRFEILASHFARAAANVRVHWLLQSHNYPGPRNEFALPVAGSPLYFSRQGWPASTRGKVGDSFRLVADDCRFLWQALLQNPPAISSRDQDRARHEYHVSAEGRVCRYYWLNLGQQDYYFDYFIDDGSVVLSPKPEE